MSKEVFFVIGRLGGKGWGGAHRVVALLANYLVLRGYKVTIIVWEDSPVDSPLEKDINVVWLHRGINSEFDCIKACYETRKVLKNHKGAYLFAFMSRMAAYAVLITFGLGIKVIGSERTDPRKEPHKAFFRWIRNCAFCFLYRAVYQTPDALAYFPKLAQRKGIIIPNPITSSLPERFTGKRKKEFITFCRIDNQKNLPMMIDAFVKVHEKYGDYVLRIYGTGLVEDKIRKYIHEIKANEYVYLSGFRSDVHSVVRDSFAFLSSSDYEGLSNSMLEAMGMGLPCICTDCPAGGAKMMITSNVNGILVPVRDIDGMAVAMIRLIENPNLCDILSKNAVHVKEKLNHNVICAKWEELMR